MERKLKRNPDFHEIMLIIWPLIRLLRNLELFDAFQISNTGFSAMTFCKSRFRAFIEKPERFNSRLNPHGAGTNGKSLSVCLARPENIFQNMSNIMIYVTHVLKGEKQSFRKMNQIYWSILTNTLRIYASICLAETNENCTVFYLSQTKSYFRQETHYPENTFSCQETMLKIQTLELFFISSFIPYIDE